MGLENRLYHHGGFLRKPPILRRAKENGGLDFSKPPTEYNYEIGALKHLPRDGFFLSPSGGAGLFMFFSYLSLPLRYGIVSRRRQDIVLEILL